ncbi:glycoside hydrolase [Posidoniimonas corsicana]|nr:glycoside hydrolase [Posidoniimonas corsicana]
MAVVLAACAIGCPESAAIDIGTAASHRNQRFEAWGSSLAWMGNELGRPTTNPMRRTQIVDMLFDQDNGLGLNFLRYNIGAGQNPAGPAITRPGAAMDGWAPSAPTDISDPSTWGWDWDADQTQRLVLGMAIERGLTQIEAFANSAPWWMTVSQSSRGNPSTGATNLDPDNYGIFGHYLLEVAEHFESNLGVHFHTLAPMNEPGATWWDGSNNQEGMHIPVGGAQSALVREVGQQIIDRGLEMGLGGPEETAIRWSVNSYDNWDATTRGFVSQINTHSYPWGGGSDAADAAALVAYNQSRPEGPKKIYATEFGTGGDSTPLSGGVTLANQITSDLNNLGAAGWTYWQAVEDNNGSNWGLIIAPFDGANNSFDTRRQFYVMKQFSQHIRPGSHILDQADDEVVASYDPRLGATTLVITNDETASVDTRTFNLLDQTVSHSRVIRTSDSEYYQALGGATVSPRGNQVTVSSPASTVTTVQLHHRPNLIQNPGFDLDGAANGASAIPGWQSVGNVAFDTGSDLTGDGSGTGRLETNSAENTGRLFQTSIGDAGADLTGVAFQLSVDLLLQSAGSANYDADAYLALEFYGADDQTLAHASADDFQTLLEPAYGINNDSHTDSAYRTYQSGRFVAPPGARYVRPVIRFDNVGARSSDWSFVDNAYLQQVHPEADAKEWASTGGGDLTDHSKWLTHASVEKNSRLYFGTAITQDAAVTLDAAEAVTGMTFFSDHQYEIAGAGALQVGAIDATALIDVRLGGHGVSVPTELIGATELQVLTDAQIEFSGGFHVSGQRLTKLGAGLVDWSTGFKLNGGVLVTYAADEATLHFGSDAVLDGGLELLLAPGQVLGVGEQFELATYSSLSDTFDTIILPSIPGGYAWRVDYGATALTATVINSVLGGDFNGDGHVDAADYTVWRDNRGAADESALAGAGDGVNGVDGGDYLLWRENFGATTTAQSLPASVPEPTSLMLAGTLGIGLLELRRRQPRKRTRATIAA